MRWKLDLNEKYKETTITIHASEISEEISTLTKFIDQMTKTLSVKKDDEQITLDLFKVIYIENIERLTFIYTEKNMYEIDRPLYDLEEELATLDFMRINKQTLINPRYIQSVKALFNSRYELSMTSDEKLIVTRHYRKKFKALFIEGGLYDA